MGKEIGSTAHDAEQEALNEEQTVATMENAANSPRNDVARNLELHEERSGDGPARATQDPAAPELSAAPNPPETRGRTLAGISRRKFFTTAGIAAASLPLGLRESVAQEVFGADSPALDREPLVIQKQGSFFVGGTTITSASGEIFYIDHLYAQFQVPPNARQLPLVMTHGTGQTTKTWESTPDGRDGFQTIFPRRGWQVYLTEAPRRGRAGILSFTGPLGNLDGSQIIPDRTTRTGATAAWVVWRLGPVWGEFYPNTQFPRTPEAVNQFARQTIANVTDDDHVITNAFVALLDKIGPAILIPHSMSGPFGMLAVIKSPKVKALVTYEPARMVFPAGEPRPPIVLSDGSLRTSDLEVPPSDFMKLTKIPIQVVYGDNIPTTPDPVLMRDSRRGQVIAAKQFVDAVNRHGGDAQFLSLPEMGLYGNTHFMFFDLNNVQVADLLSEFLHRKGLDMRGEKHE